MLAAPTNVLGSHIGNGVILLSWTPVEGAVSYEVWVSTVGVDGPYAIYNLSILTDNRGHLYNIPIGAIIFVQLRAIDVNDNPGDFGQALLGDVAKPTAQFLVSAITGSQVPASAVFTVQDSAGRLIGIEAAADIDISS